MGASSCGVTIPCHLRPIGVANIEEMRSEAANGALGDASEQVGHGHGEEEAADGAVEGPEPPPPRLPQTPSRGRR